jgi:large subunit ribosomal protein L3
MVSTWDKWGSLIPLTVVHMDRNQVVDIKTPERDGYHALQIGCGQKNPKYMRKSQMGHYLKADVGPKTYLKEFKITEENKLPIGYVISPRHFTVGQFVDIKGKTRGKGFQGAMQRWGFKGLPASHGHSLSHRSLGGTGACQDPGRVLKGKKMPGRGGYKMRMMKGLMVYKIDVEKSLIYIKGSVPGANGSLLQIRDAMFTKKNRDIINFPSFIYEKGKKYASVIEAEPPKEDPVEQWLHENAVIKGEQEAGGGGEE